MASIRKPIIMKQNQLKQKTNFARTDLEAFFANNIVEVTFRRRKTPTWFKKNREPGHMSFHRRMLCTSNWKFISSPIARQLYKWKRPNPKNRKGRSYYRNHKMLLVWDIFALHWRIVSLDKYAIVGYTPVHNLRQGAEFTEFYRQHLRYLPESKKKHFNDI